MMRTKKYMLRVALIFLVAVMSFTTAQGGILTSAARESLEWIARKAGTEAGEKAAERTATRLLRESTNEAVRTLVKKYGDDAARLCCNPSRIKLVDSLGDDAAEALLKHGAMAEKLLLKSPHKATARFISSSEAKDVRQMEILLKECAPQPQQEASLLNFIARHPKLVAYPTVMAATTGSAYLWAHQHQDECLVQMLLWTWHHPAWAASLILGILVTLSILWWWVKKRVRHMFARQ